MLVQLLKNLLSLFLGSSANNKLPEPTSEMVISLQGLNDILRKRFPDTQAQLYLSDSLYLLCNDNDIGVFLKQDQTNKTGYVPEEYDCDDFAYHLMGQFSIPKWSYLAVGMVWTDKHALNCFVDSNEKFWFIEPQTDEILAELKDWMGTQIRFIAI